MPYSSAGSQKVKCKICAGQVLRKHTVSGIDYFYCRHCDFLQNYYWESGIHDTDEQTYVNNDKRSRCWPPGDKNHMYEKGWEILQLMFWPLAWQSRQVNKAINRIPLIKRHIKRKIAAKAGRLMDFGCGHGIALLELRRRDDIDVIGVDPYSPATSKHIVCQTIFDANFPDDHFDGIFSIETVEHLTDCLRVFRELFRVLKPGGVLLVQTSRLEDPGYKQHHEKWFYLADPKTHVSIYSRAALTEICRRVGFRSVKFKGTKFARFVK